MSDMIVASRYRVGELVGTGGMGAVYRADDLVHGGEVALKMLRPDRADDRMARGYLRAEGRLSGRIAHRNVVPVLDAGTTETDDPYVVMELVRGKSLRALVPEQGAPTIRGASAIVQQVLAGLDAIHAAGFVHGDVKADNVLVDDHDRVTLIDFGLMRSRSERVYHDDGMTSGTPEYMAPEVIRGEAPTIESDLYAVGALLYELLTGATPFAGGNSIEVLCRHLEDEVVPVGLRCQERSIPKGIEDVVRRALEKQPSARFRSARAFGYTLAAATPATEPVYAKIPTVRADATTVSWSARMRRHAAGTQPPRSRRNHVRARTRSI